MSNSGLNAAKAKKYDEFYTRRQDIEAELKYSLQGTTQGRYLT